MLPPSAPSPGWAEEFSCLYMVKLSPQIIVFYVCKEHALGIINLLSSLGGSHAAIVLWFGSMFHASIAWFCT